MNLLIILMCLVLPAKAADNTAANKEAITASDMQVGTFEEDVEGVYAKLRRLIWESKSERYARSISDGLKMHDSGAAQKSLDAMLKEYPELKREEPQMIRHHQGAINFWKKDYDGAYKEFDSAIRDLEAEYPKGFPQDKYWENNTSFMAKLYFNRGATLLVQGKYAGAVADIDKAIAVSPKPRAYMQEHRCQALLQLGKYPEASAAYDQAYKIDPTFVMNRQDRASICDVLLKNKLQPQACKAAK